MVNKKQTLRIGTFLAILMFLLMPLLSSPVAAGFTSASTCDTENKGNGEVEVSVTIPSGPYPIRYYDTAPRTANFTLTYTFSDSNPTGDGSEHYAVLYVERIVPEAGPLVNETGVIELGPSGYLPGTLTVTDDWNQYDEKLWHVHVQVGCRELPDGEWVEDSDNYQVEMKD